MNGHILEIQRFCTHDGPGIRTTVFLKGCFLRCLWCHNPESISPKRHLSYVPGRCIGCDQCAPACPQNALRIKESGEAPDLDRSRCDVCEACADVCDVEALEIVGYDASVEEVMEIVLRDRDYYQSSGGGMTMSGGEPAFQPDFTVALLRAAKSEGLHTAVDTSGAYSWGRLERIIPYADLLLYDYKETDPDLHKRFTGRSNDLVFSNLRAASRAGANIVLRCPIIPEHNARWEHLNGIAAIVKELPDLKGVDLLPYHRLARAKLDRMGLPERMPSSIEPPDADTVSSWRDYLRRKGVTLVDTSVAPEPVRLSSRRSLMRGLLGA